MSMKKFHQVYNVIVDEEIRDAIADVCGKDCKCITEADVQKAMKTIGMGNPVASGSVSGDIPARVQLENKKYYKLLLSFDSVIPEVGVFDVIVEGFPSINIIELGEATSLWKVTSILSDLMLQIENIQGSYDIKYKLYELPFKF